MHHAFLYQDVEEGIISLLKSAGSDVGISDFPPIIIEIPRQRTQGHVSTNIAMRLAKTLKKKPVDIATDFSQACKKRLAASSLADVVERIEVVPPGFINFFLKDSFLHDALTSMIASKAGAACMPVIGSGKKVLLEFVSANPTGPLSIAHARQAVVGDALARVLAAVGYDVAKEYYNNDEGNQITILGRSLMLRYQQAKRQHVEFPEECYQGEYLVELARELLEEKRDITDEAEFREIALQNLTSTIQIELADFGVRFDEWYSQRERVSGKKVADVFEGLRKKGYIYDQDGAVWFKSTAFGDDKDRVVVKSDKHYTYLAPDMAYHQDKFKRGYEWLINIWGPDHHGYIPRIKAAVQALGHPAGSLDVIIVQLATIFRNGKALSMSTRKGQYITLREVMDEVGRDAARFFLLMRRTSSHLDFDLELAKKQTPENPVYYVQYAHARICGILDNAKELLAQAENPSFVLLREEEEKELLEILFQFSYVLDVCVRQLDPFAITGYLQTLATAFHKFYDRHRVIGEDVELSKARLGLVRGIQCVLAKGLDLLGVSPPEKM